MAKGKGVTMKREYWLVDHYRDGSRTHLEPRFSIEKGSKAPESYYKGPLTEYEARVSKNYLIKIWAKSPCDIENCPCPIKTK